MIFAIALLPILGFIGAAVDYTRANSARSSMQAALDSTALMLSKDLSEGAITTSQINSKAQTYFTALYTNPDAKSVSVNATYTANSSMGSTIQVNGSRFKRPAILRERPAEFLCGDIGEPNGFRVQLDRHIALEAGHRKIG